MTMHGERPVVIHVTTAHNANDVRIFERECRSLAATGRYSVYLAAHGTLLEDAGVSLIPLTEVPKTRAGRFSAGPRKALALSRAVSADLWHFHDPELLPVALRLARSGQRVIWDAHEDYVTQFTDGDEKNWVPAPLRDVVRTGTLALLKQVDKHAAGVVAATPTIASRYSNPRTVVVGNEARLGDFSGCRPSFEARRILFTGTVGPSHLFGELVEAVRALPQVQLAVAGREPDPQVWSAAKATLGPRVEHLGWLDRANLAEAISDSSLGVALYVPVPSFLEADGSPTKLFEFAAAGLPTIGTPNPSVARLLEDSGAGFLAAGFSASDLRAAISQALSDAVSWRDAANSARLWSATMGGWAQSEHRLLKLYAEVLGRSSAPSNPRRLSD